MQSYLLFALTLFSQVILAGPGDTLSFLINSIESDQPIIALDCSPNGNYLAVAGAGDVIDVYQSNLGVKVKSFVGHTDDILCVRFSPDNRLLATGGVDTRIVIWDVAT